MTEAREVIEEITRLRHLVAAAFFGCLPAPSDNFDRTRLDAQIFEEVIRIRRLVFSRIAAALRPADVPHPRAGRDRGQEQQRRERGDEDLEARATRVLESLQAFVLQHPVASQKVFSALVAEGRRYAATEEGARWVARLDGSPLLRRARQLWESSLTGLLDDDPDTVLPSEYVEILMHGTKLTAPEDLGSRIPGGMAGTAP